MAGVIQRPKEKGFLGSLLQGIGAIASVFPGGQMIGAGLGALGTAIDGDAAGAGKQIGGMISGQMTPQAEAPLSMNAQAMKDDESFLEAARKYNQQQNPTSGWDKFPTWGG